ncbi:MAG TPA: L,D-transpeptidase [Mariprofundaceae bacterium]|nr:L,D-transpeptidase [Mariprofundaceae bacterium]
MIVISVSEQLLHHRRPTGVWQCYPISTAANGTGNREGSFQTPLGRHRIVEKIGEGMPRLTAFVAREPFTIFNPETDDGNRDWILTRILWLTGCETGKNRRGKVDTKSRYIYIHGTHDEAAIGSPCSHGCIRMKTLDILELFEHTFPGERVNIRA